MRMMFRSQLLIAALALVFSIAGATAASADSGFTTRTYLIGVGFLIGPDVAMAAIGETIEITGAGTLSIHPKSVTGAGTFTHKAADGTTVLATGTWTATQLLTFSSYGAPVGFPFPTFDGGYARMRIHLAPVGGGAGVDAILEFDCNLGLNPPGHEEGVRLAIQGGPNFNEKVSGETVFIIP